MFESDRNSKICKDGEGAQGCSSGRSKECKEPGAFGGGPTMDWVPWLDREALGLRIEEMVTKLLGDKDNRWHGTVRQAPEKRTAKEWRKVYGFAKEGE